MFTGIVEEVGTVAAAGRRMRIQCRLVLEDIEEGASIAVNGVCLTATQIEPNGFWCDLSPETLARTNLGALREGSVVNLERPLSAGGRLGGHIVQGHVDGTGAVVARRPAPNWDVVRISIPPSLARYVVEKGSVAVDGISLTVSALGESDGQHWFEVSLIPATLERTTLGSKQPGAVVNLEVDMIAKYVERLLGSRGEPLPTAQPGSTR